MRICSVHFRPEQLKKSLTGRCRLIEGANPEIFCPTNPQKTQVLPNHSPPKRPYLGDEVVVVNKIRRVSGEMHNTATYSTKDVFNPFIDHSYCKGQKKDKDVVDPQGKTSRACQTDLTIDDWRLLQEEADRLKIENAELLKKCCNKAEQKRNFFYDDVVKSDESVKFYTGIPSHSCLLMLFDVLASLMQEFILTLVKLRLGLTGKQLGDIFSISETQVSRIVTTWVCFLSSSLKETLVTWPSRQLVTRKLPQTFNKYPNTRVIIDCTEMFVEKPTSPHAQKATWSEYKQHNTIKTLVGITPNGYFSFLSKFWSGSTSDRKITQECGIIDMLEEGDAVMADRGFNIRDLLTKKKVFLNIPPFSKKGNNYK